MWLEQFISSVQRVDWLPLTLPFTSPHGSSFLYVGDGAYVTVPSSLGPLSLPREHSSGTQWSQVTPERLQASSKAAASPSSGCWMLRLASDATHQIRWPGWSETNLPWCFPPLSNFTNKQLTAPLSGKIKGKGEGGEGEGDRDGNRDEAAASTRSINFDKEAERTQEENESLAIVGFPQAREWHWALIWR